MLGHKTSLYKFKKIEIISSIFPIHNDMKLEISCKMRAGKNHKYVESEQHRTEQLLGQQINQSRNPKYLKKIENDIRKSMG